MWDVKLAKKYSPDANVTLHKGDCLGLLKDIPDESAHLVVTSPPYNIGKKYERRVGIDSYVAKQAAVIAECVRILNRSGSVCWQVGNHIAKDGQLVPLDIVLYPVFKRCGLRLRNRIVWHFEHGLHCRRRFSGRCETILWFTKTSDYQFNLDPVRVPQKYPGKKYFKGPKAGQYSCNPLGKNPGDLWVIPNVKHNHPEKTVHPCQFPVELIERLVLSMTDPGQLVVDPFIGVGTTAVAAIRRGRRAAGADTSAEYIKIAQERVQAAARGTLRVRTMGTPVYRPPLNSSLTTGPFRSTARRPQHPTLFSISENAGPYTSKESVTAQTQQSAKRKTAKSAPSLKEKTKKKRRRSR